MLEFDFQARRGSFHLQVECCFASEWTVIFGPSGAGKSTLLRLLAGLDLPDFGSIALDGRTLSDSVRRIHRKPGHRNTALVAQQPALFPHMSVEANVSYGLAGLNRNFRTQRIEEMLALVDGANLAHRRPRDLSGGEAQRVALARALAPLPKLLLLDEPFSALDGAASDALLERLKVWLSKRNVQTILVTHDATDAYASGAEVAFLRDGRIVALGPANTVLADERRRILERLGSDQQGSSNPSRTGSLSN
jgi:ABC-type sulfate/molybdate transport systems ATPase subunit